VISHPASDSADLLESLELDAAPVQEQRWIQVGITPSVRSPESKLYADLASFVRHLLAEKAIIDFFFVHKPPGMRLRFDTSGVDAAASVERSVYGRLHAWRDEGSIESIVSGVYEPEEYLFGGPRSMECVHRLSTVDSLAWLDYHALGEPDGHRIGPAWVLSLAMLRAFFGAIGISDWEDIDVWDRIEKRMGRRVPMDALTHPVYQPVAAGIQSHWLSPDQLRGTLGEAALRIADSFADAVQEPAVRWRCEYFDTRAARIGPRAAAALFTIFHWNRAGLPLVRQGLITTALLQRQTI
jgi:thiopeptide-type bacteriocin biosynthesis protein